MKRIPIQSKIWMGIDPGTTAIGYGFIEESDGKLKCLDYGIISNPGLEKLADLNSTYRSLKELVRKYKPRQVAVEKLFFFKNQKTVIPVSEMRGVILLSLMHAGIPIVEYTPLQVKQTVCNYGLADKKQVQKMVQNILNIKAVIKPDDASDALALAICCSLSRDPALRKG